MSAVNLSILDNGHRNDLIAAYGSGFTVATSGTTQGTVVYPNTADPAGTANITEPYGVCDTTGAIQITTSGTQTTGTLVVINFKQQFPWVPTGVSASISKLSDGSTAGGSLTLTTTASSLTISVGTALTTATTYVIRYTIQG